MDAGIKDAIPEEDGTVTVQFDNGFTYTAEYNQSTGGLTKTTKSDNTTWVDLSGCPSGGCTGSLDKYVKQGIFTIPSTGEAEGPGIILIAAAAGGGFAVVFVVLYLTVMRRNDRPKNVSSVRDVVAFENPMYEEQMLEDGNVPAYSSSSGLYDDLPQSSANSNMVHNPMFDGDIDEVNTHSMMDEDAGYLNAG